MHSGCIIGNKVEIFEIEIWKHELKINKCFGGYFKELKELSNIKIRIIMSSMHEISNITWDMFIIFRIKWDN